MNKLNRHNKFSIRSGKFTWIARLLHEYYSCIFLVPLYKQRDYNTGLDSNQTGAWKFLYTSMNFACAVRRFIFLLKTAHLLKVIIGTFQYEEGELKITNVYTLFGSFIYMFGEAPIFITDDILLYNYTYTNLTKLLTALDDASQSITLGGTRNLNFKQYNCCIFLLLGVNLFFDYFATVSWSAYFLEVIAQDPGLIYASSPWKSNFMEKLCWAMEAWTYLLVFPACISYQIAGCINSIANHPNIHCQLNQMNTILLGVQILEMETRWCQNLLWSFIVFGSQQCSTAYFMFQSLKVEDYSAVNVTLMDLLPTTLRVILLYEGLSHVAKASENWYKQATRGIFSTCLHGKGINNRIIRRKIRHTKPLKIKVGKVFCNGDLTLTGMRVYLDYIVAAALWP